MLLISLTLFFLILLLIIPVELVFDFNNLDNKRSSIEFKMFFGLIQFQLYPKKKAKIKEKIVDSKYRDKDADIKGKKRFTFNKIFKIAMDEQFVAKVTGFIKNIFRSVKLRLEKLNIRLGLDDPADTGMLWGFVGPASAVLNFYCKHNVAIEPEFQDSVLDIDARGKVSVIPIEIVFISLVFLLSPLTVKTFWVNFVRSAE